MNSFKVSNTLYCGRIFPLALILALLGLTVLLSLKVYALEHAQNDLNEQLKRAKQTHEDEELIMQVTMESVRQTLESELRSVGDELRRCDARKQNVPRAGKVIRTVSGCRYVGGLELWL